MNTIRFGFMGWVGVVGLAVGCGMPSSRGAVAQIANALTPTRRMLSIESVGSAAIPGDCQQRWEILRRPVHAGVDTRDARRSIRGARPVSQRDQDLRQDSTADGGDLQQDRCRLSVAGDGSGGDRVLRPGGAPRSSVCRTLQQPGNGVLPGVQQQARPADV